MNTQSETRKSPPAYRLCFSAKTGVDRDGRAILSYPIEVGACFHRTDPSKGLVARFTIIPSELREGVLLLMPVTASDAAQGDLLNQSITAEAGQ